MDGEPITQCPRRWIKDEPALSADMFWFYRRYDKGLLPEDGGLQSQPAKFVQAMKIMEAAFNKVDVEEAKKRERKAAAPQPGKKNAPRRTAPGFSR